LLRVDPKKRMVFNPEESIDLHGYTATFIQYAYARIRSILRKAGNVPDASSGERLLPLEKSLTMLLEKFPAILEQACQEMNPAVVAAFAFELAKTFNSFYAEHSVAGAETPEKQALRLQLCRLTATVLRNAMNVLGIRVPERM
jgi:arginyl-tRNA synthetase